MRGWKGFAVRPAVSWVTVLVVALAASGTASAAFRGSNGRVVFRTNRDGNAEVYTMNADGSGRVDVSRNPAEDVDPRWSPDGSRIVFASNRGGGYDIYTMAADGTDPRRLTSTGNNNRRPTWTADGHILFHAGFFPNRAIFRMNADGSEVQQLTPASSDNAYPAAAPVGSRVAFSSVRDGTQRLYTMNADGGAVRMVTPAPPGPETSDVEANWSPRANDLVFVRFDSFDGSELYVAHTDGSGLRELTDTPDRVEFEPAWSPDNSKIVFHACGGLGTPTQHCAVYVINSDGTGESEISTPSIPYLDTFSGDRLDPFWNGPFAIGGGALASMTQSNGELEVSLPSAAPLDPSSGFISIATNSRCTLSGDYDVQVDYRLLRWPAPHAVNVGFGTNTTDFSLGYGMFVFDPGTGTGLSTGFPGGNNTFVPSVPAAGTLRLTRVGSTITAYRLVESGWTAVQSTDGTLADQEISLDLFSNASPGTNGDVTIAYDNLRVSSGTFSCPTWWDDNAPDWQPIGDN